jgi:hypothetical protein
LDELAQSLTIRKLLLNNIQIYSNLKGYMPVKKVDIKSQNFFIEGLRADRSLLVLALTGGRKCPWGEIPIPLSLKRKWGVLQVSSLSLLTPCDKIYSKLRDYFFHSFSFFVTVHWAYRCEGVQYCEATHREHRPYACEVTIFCFVFSKKMKRETPLNIVK